MSLLGGQLHPPQLGGVLDGQLDGVVVHEPADLQSSRLVIGLAGQREQLDQGLHLINVLIL